jgi:RNA polymerase sigma-70 factor (TIGR02943 family)
MSFTAKGNSEGKSDFSLSTDLLDTHADYLYNFARGQVRDASTAEDLVQETLLAAVKSQSSFGGKSSERTWLVGILRHKIYDHLRKVCRERSVGFGSLPLSGGNSWEESALWLHQVAAESQLPSRHIELDEFRASLEIALGKLPPRIAQVFRLYEMEEHSNREVCAQLNITECNLWAMLHRARKQLRVHLASWWSSEPDRKISDAHPKT